MPFNFFRKKKTSNVPIWASFFDDAHYEEFIRVLDGYFKSKGATYTINDGVLTTPDVNPGQNSFGLLNLAQTCNLSKPKDYPQIITDHFEKMIKAYNYEMKFADNADDFEAAKQFIAMRLHHNSYTDHLKKQYIFGKEFAGDIYAMLVFDLPESVINIHQKHAKAWGKTLDEVFDVAIENTKKLPLTITKQSVGEFSIYFIQANHFFAPNIVFDLEAHPEMIGSKGALIGIPHRHAVIIYPIESTEVVKAVSSLIPIVHGINAEGPGSISNNLLWYHDNVFENQPYKITGDKIEFSPTPKFTAMMKQLSD